MRKFKFLLVSIPLFISLFYAWGEEISFPIGDPQRGFSGLNDRDNSFAISASQAQALLNVNITPGGKSVKKREGYGLAQTLSVSTSPVHGTYTFFDSTGNTVDLYFNDTRMSGSVAGATPTVLFSTGPNGATYQCTDSLGFAYCANSQRTTLIKTNGASYSQLLNVNSTGTMVATCVTRLAMAGFAGSPSRIDFSQDTDFTTWTTGSLGSSGVQITINAPGAKITHIVYAFGRLIWFKDTSFGYIIIGNQPLQTDWVVKTVSYDVGTNDNTSVYREGILYFRGQDSHIYTFDGSNYQRLTREISGTIGQSQTRSAGSWTQTSQADFQAGITDPQGFISTAAAAGSLVLDTATAVSSFVDTVSTDFGAGTILNLDTTTVLGSIYLSSYSAMAVQYQQYGADSSDGGTNSACSSQVSQSFSIGSIPMVFSSATVRLRNTTSGSDARFYLYSDSGNSPNAQIAVSTWDVPATISTSYGDYVIAFPSTVLSANTRYWLRMTNASSPFGSSPISIVWALTNGSFSESSRHDSTCTNDTTKNAKYKIWGTTVSYNTSGSLVSRAFDVGFTTNSWLWSWSTFTVTRTLPTNTTLTYETQTSSSSTGIWNSLISVSSGSAPTSIQQEFIRYKATFTTTDTSTSPILSDVTIAMTSRLRPGGTFYSQVKNAANLTAWDAFLPTKIDSGGTHTFGIRSSSNSIAVNSSTPSWTPITSGAVPTVSTGSGGVYFQIADYIKASTYTDNPSLSDFTQNWFEGSAADKAYATYFNDKIWWSVTSGTGATTNNKILLYDMLNQGWLIYDLASNGFFVRNNHLYFGSSSDGHIYKFGDVDNDNGAAINSYWKSKDFFGDSPFTDKDLSSLSLTASSVANSSMTVTYTLNGSSATSFITPLYTANSSFTKRNRLLPLGVTGNTYSIQFGNNAADQPWEVFGLQVGIRPKPWAVTTP